MRPLFFVEDTAGDVEDGIEHMTTMIMMKMMRIEVMMITIILSTQDCTWHFTSVFGLKLFFG